MSPRRLRAASAAARRALVVGVALGVTAACGGSPAGAPHGPSTRPPTSASPLKDSPSPLPRTRPRHAEAWVTTADGRLRLSHRPALPFGSPASPGLDIHVHDGQRHQHFFGVGAALTGASASLLRALPAPARRRAMDDLFDRHSGIGLSVLRQPLGASDFSRGSYSYDDVPQGQSDPGLTRFSLGRDATEVAPLVRAAARTNPSLAVVLSSWSAPAWMKTSDSLVGGTLDSRDADAYARYLVRSVQAYDALGVPVHGLTIQNEPSFSPPGYAGMLLSVDPQRDLIDHHLAPALAAAGLAPHVWALDDNFDQWRQADALLSDPTTRSHVYGTAFHCYRGSVSALRRLRARHPGLPVAISECSGGAWSPGFGSDLRYEADTMLVHGIRDGAAWLAKWNAALDPSGGPTNGGCQNCRGLLTVDPRTHTVRRGAAYFALGHVGRFVTPGAQVVGSTTHGGHSVESVAFRNPDGSHALVVFNGAQARRSFRVDWHGRAFRAGLPAGALATYTW
ncbi:MAG: glycoside hydrolase family 30 protein [Nocardioidaceae bacterium]